MTPSATYKKIQTRAVASAHLKRPTTEHTMRLQDLYIPEPCQAEWHVMDGDNQRRFCTSCREHVHDLSAMTEREAQALLDATGGDLCVQYVTDERGRIIFSDTSPEARMYWQRDGIARLVAAAALALPLGLAAACDSPQPATPQAEAPIVMRDGQPARLNTSPGSGRAPVAPSCDDDGTREASSRALIERLRAKKQADALRAQERQQADEAYLKARHKAYMARPGHSRGKPVYRPPTGITITTSADTAKTDHTAK